MLYTNYCMRCVPLVRGHNVLQDCHDLLHALPLPATILHGNCRFQLSILVDIFVLIILIQR